MMPKKTVTAFKFTCEHLFRFRPKVYFWTFTQKEVIPAWSTPVRWSMFIRDIMHAYGKFRGVRVFEWHVNHGLHVHALVDLRLDIHELRRIGARHGWGVMWVKVADKNAPQYLCKYLGKDYGKMPNGGRQWATFGGTKNFGTRVRDVRTYGERADYIRNRMMELRPFTTQFLAMQQACHEWDHRLSYEAVRLGYADEIATAEE